MQCSLIYIAQFRNCEILWDKKQRMVITWLKDNKANVVGSFYFYSKLFFVLMKFCSIYSAYLKSISQFLMATKNSTLCKNHKVQLYLRSSTQNLIASWGDLLLTDSMYALKLKNLLNIFFFFLPSCWVLVEQI